MPKMKTNKMAAKKFRANAAGKLKRGQANTSHNTAKMTPKRRRQLRGQVWVDDTNVKAIRKMMPYTVAK